MARDARIPEVAFPESLRNAILTGTRLVTKRRQPVGEGGSLLIAFGHEFVIVDVTEVPLGLVAAVLFREDGFGTGKAFIDHWRRAYPDAAICV